MSVEEKGQTTFEYLLLIGGAVLLAVFVLYSLYTSGQQAGKEVNQQFQRGTQIIGRELNELEQNFLGG